MNSTALYRQRAVECYSLADGFADPDQRKAMRQLASCWLDLLELSSKNSAARNRALSWTPSALRPSLRPTVWAECGMDRAPGH